MAASAMHMTTMELVHGHSPALQQTQSLGSRVGISGKLTVGLQSAVSALRATAEADDVLYKKARVYMRCRPKRVLFNVNHHLYHSGKLEEDVKRLKNDHYEEVVPPASVIWGERFDQDVLQSSKTLNEDNFWTFVHSVAWRKFSSIRVTEGALLDSLLFAYNSLVRDGKLYSYVTDVYQNNSADDKGEQETIKITFTYYAPSLKALDDVIYRHQGSRVSIDALAQQNDNSPSKLDINPGSPDITLDFAWSPDDQGGHRTPGSMPHATPVNPPNSPTPSASPTQTLLKKRKDQLQIGSRRGDVVKYPSSYYSLPLVLRNRFTLGLKPKGDDRMAIEGKSLQCRKDKNCQYTPFSEVYFTQDYARKTFGYKSSLQAVRSSLGNRSNTVILPLITPTPARQDEVYTAFGKSGDNSSPLQGCLASPSKLRKEKERHRSEQDSPSPSPRPRPESKRQLTFSPNLEYINMVQRVTPGPFTPKLPANNAFDTKKLFINWSLEKIRQARGRRRGKKRYKAKPTPKDVLKTLAMQDTDKDYLLGKFLADQPEGSSLTVADKHDEQCPLHEIKDICCEQCLRQITRPASPSPIVTKHTDVRKLRFASAAGGSKVPGWAAAGTSPVFPVGFADSMPDFRHGCYMSTLDFIIRKEQVTTSKAFVTVTSLTINKIPDGGFMKWQYLTDETMLDK